MHHNLRHALEDFQKATAFLHQEMSNLSPEDIKEAFANNGYMGMLSKSCKNCGRNDAGQWMYDCVWSDNDIGVHFTRIFVKIAGDKLLADV